jgi:hypothetical protein
MLQAKTSRIQNHPEKRRILGAIAIALIILVWGIWYFLHAFPSAYHTREFKRTFMEFGSYARIVIFFVLAHVVLKTILQKRYVDRWTQVKQGVVFLARIARQWHVPAAIAAIGLVLLHVLGALLAGFRLDFHYISGLLAFLVLILQAISGIFRYRRLDRKWHLGLGITFAVLFLLHSFL